MRRECSQSKGKQTLSKSSGRSQPSILHVFEEMAGTFLGNNGTFKEKHRSSHRPEIMNSNLNKAKVF